VDAVRTLVELGANVNAQNSMTGATPLHMVAQSQKASPADRLEVIDILISGGAAVDKADNYGQLPIQVVQVGTTESSPPDAVASPVLHDDDTHVTLQTFMARLQPERPALFAAIAQRDLAFVQDQCATSQGASLTTLSFQGMLPLSFAVDEFLEVCRTSRHEVETNELENLWGIIQVLLHSGADVNGGISSDDKANPAALLMGAGADTKDPPLHRAICQIRETFKSNPTTESSTIFTLSSLITKFVDSGAAISEDTVLLLHQAARFNEVAFAQFLIDVLHVDPNAKGRQGMTPLHFAARSGQVEMVVRFAVK
jgi:Ankyrin repeats (many copies)